MVGDEQRLSQKSLFNLCTKFKLAKHGLPLHRKAVNRCLPFFCSTLIYRQWITNTTLSFAGEDRDYVEAVANILNKITYRYSSYYLSDRTKFQATKWRTFNDHDHKLHQPGALLFGVKLPFHGFFII